MLFGSHNRLIPRLWHWQAPLAAFEHRCYGYSREARYGCPRGSEPRSRGHALTQGACRTAPVLGTSVVRNGPNPGHLDPGHLTFRTDHSILRALVAHPYTLEHLDSKTPWQ